MVRLSIFLVTKNHISYKGERNVLSAETSLQNLTASVSAPFKKKIQVTKLILFP